MAQASAEQINYVRALQLKLRITNTMLDTYCKDEWGFELRFLDRREVSRLIDEMKSWRQAPASMLRAMGQRDLPGLGV